MMSKIFSSLVIALALSIASVAAFAPSASNLPLIHARTCNNHHLPPLTLNASPEDNNLGVIDLTDDDDDDTPVAEVAPAAPFLSQGEMSDDPNLLSPDFSDAKQTRVIIYIILTLVPILFLVPLMIGSRDLIPLDMLPPVEMQ